MSEENKPRRRKQYVSASRFLSQLEADDNSPLTINWSKSGMTAFQIINQHQKGIVARSRSEYLNNDYLKKFVRDCKANISGDTGIQIQFKTRQANGRRLDDRLNEACRQAWNLFSEPENIDIKGMRGRVQLEHKAIHDAAIDGEFMNQILQGEEAGPYGFAINPIDTQRCPVEHNIDARTGGNYVRHGIENNRFGRPLKYLIHDSDGRTEYGAYYNTSPYSSLVAISSNQMVHGFVHELPEGQGRGMPWTTSALLRLHMIRNYETAVGINATVNARQTGAMEMPQEWLDDSLYSPDEKEEFFDEIEIKPGEYKKIPYGSALHAVPSNFPNKDHGDFLKALLRGVASGIGDNYNTLANDGEGVNYSTMRHFAINDREYWRCMQDFFIQSWFRKIFKRWLEYALLSGKIVYRNGKRVPASLYGRIVESVEINGRRWGWVDPDKEEKAASEAQGRMRKAASDIVGEHGVNYERTLQKIGDDLDKAERELKLPRQVVAMIYFGNKDIANAFISNEIGSSQPGT